MWPTIIWFCVIYLKGNNLIACNHIIVKSANISFFREMANMKLLQRITFSFSDYLTFSGLLWIIFFPWCIFLTLDISGNVCYASFAFASKLFIALTSDLEINCKYVYLLGLYQSLLYASVIIVQTRCLLYCCVCNPCLLSLLSS